MKSKMIKIFLDEISPDPNQPRKSFDKEAIENLAQTIKTQGIINPIEIDENNMIITGEMRYRAALRTFPHDKEIECKLLIGLDYITKLERQTIENLHHNILTDSESDNAIQRLWESNEYNSIQGLAKRLGRSLNSIKESIKMPELRKEIGKENLVKLGKRSSIRIDQAIKNKVEKKKVIKKAVEENLSQPQVHKLVNIIKELPKDVKDEVLKPKAKITLKEAEELIDIPIDIRKEVFKEVDPITIKEAKEVAEFPKPEQRKAIIKEIKQTKKRVELTKKAGEKIIQQKRDIVKGKRPAPVKVIDLDVKFVNAWKNTKLIDIPIKIKKGFLESYSEDTKQECLRLVKSVVNYLIKEFSEEVKIIE